MRLMKFVLMAAIVSAPAITFAEAPAPAAQNHSIRQRQFNQQRRIRSGFRRGQLNRRQTARLERQQRSIRHEVRSLRARHDGRLTRRDRGMITHRQNIASRRIYRAKHNRRIG